MRGRFRWWRTEVLIPCPPPASNALPRDPENTLKRDSLANTLLNEYQLPFSIPSSFLPPLSHVHKALLLVYSLKTASLVHSENIFCLSFFNGSFNFSFVHKNADFTEFRTFSSVSIQHFYFFTKCLVNTYCVLSSRKANILAFGWCKTDGKHNQ